MDKQIQVFFVNYFVTNQIWSVHPVDNKVKSPWIEENGGHQAMVKESMELLKAFSVRINKENGASVGQRSM